MKKLAVIRSDSFKEAKCPFGLNINFACKNAGNSTEHMTVINDIEDEDQDLATKHNNLLFYKNKDNTACIYSAHIIKNKKNIIDCNYGDSAAGFGGNKGIDNSVYYSKLFNGQNLPGITAYPLGYYHEPTYERGNLYGLYDMATKQNDMIKIANAFQPYKSKEDEINKRKKLLDKIKDQENN